MSVSVLLASGIALAVSAAEARALPFRFPAPATATARSDTPLGSYAMPVGPWTGGAMQTLAAEGPRHQTAWRLAEHGVSTMLLMADLRGQLMKDGFRILYQCNTRNCGGFDFRYGTDVLPEPEMHVDLGDFRYLAAERPTTAGPEYLSLIVSRSVDAGFVQVVRIGGAEDKTVTATPSTKNPTVLSVAEPDGTEAPAAGIAAALETGGSVALDDLSFDSGSSELAKGDFASLAELATYLKENPDRRIAVVGHTDAEGGLTANLALSKKRAASVRQRLIKDYGVDPGRVAADGVGFLAPRASNLTEAGREQNRRVEVILTSTQ